ncbi:putative colanic acid biosynthesis acetyltransferase WcaF [Cyanobacterium sp. HL-69]|uniref:WcaF family extracellular polysaccharide biosynthesis acetyltransferase n=1 Tax=Cyanobacterium sp. HL-69 TaxID=2054282 RepID=UPI000CA0F403|nr:putative colanic acid biosynthesis acetyltransferase WcaF [Cyanobacterium sp. HL-69]
MTNHEPITPSKNQNPVLDTEPWFNLSKYNQNHFDRGKPLWFILLWWIVEGIIFPLTPHNFNGVRRTLLKLFGAKVGKQVVIRSSARFLYPWKVEIGDYSWIGDRTYFYSLDKIIIGSHTVISQHSYLCTGSHDYNQTTFDLITSPIMIGNGVWVASDCFIAPGVKIGANTIIGTRSTVLHNIPSTKIAWGSPCKVKCDRKPPHNVNG